MQKLLNTRCFSSWNNDSVTSEIHLKSQGFLLKDKNRFLENEARLCIITECSCSCCCSCIHVFQDKFWVLTARKVWIFRSIQVIEASVTFERLINLIHDLKGGDL